MFKMSYFFINFIILFSTFVILLYKYATRNFGYWEKKKVFYIEPLPFFGNFLDICLFKVTAGEYLMKLYKQTAAPFFGIFVFDSPYLIVKSPDLVKSILVKDFNNFTDRSIVSSQTDPLTAHMLFMEKNPEWRVMRKKMTPVFSSGKLKTMLTHINGVGEELKRYLDKQIPHFSVEAKEICAKYSTDVIAKCAFAINAHSFDDIEGEFRKVGRMVFDFRWSVAIQQTAYFFMPRLVSLFRMRFIDLKASTFLRNAFWDAIERREKTNTMGNDLIDTIIDLKKNKQFCEEFNFDGDKVVAQAAQFFLAGFETTSSTMAFALYELCIHPHIQKKLRAEIRSCLQAHGGFTFEAIQSMKYLHMCVCETLRKYPVLPFLERKCNAEYAIPGTDVVIEKGTPVFIPLFALHYDDQYFPNPNKFNPERFSDENINNITAFSYIPFGDGPRNCIGERFGMLGTKAGLVHILSEFEVEKSPDTPIPLVYEAKTFVLASKVGLPMKFKKAFISAA